jgi:hypothetical protein
LGLPTAEGEVAETKWVFPETFFQQLPQVMKDATPLPGEEAKYAQIRTVHAAAEQDTTIMAAMVDEAMKAEVELVDPLLQFRNWGVQLDSHWSTTNNNAAFGADYFTRTAVAKSNILVNAPTETKYFYQDLDRDAHRLNGANTYTVTFPKGATPPVDGFWSLTLYDARAARPLSADTVDKVASRSCGSIWIAAGAPRCSSLYAGFGIGVGNSFASFRRFWAAAARWNSSLAPFGPRSRKRSNLRMRLR